MHCERIALPTEPYPHAVFRLPIYCTTHICKMQIIFSKKSHRRLKIYGAVIFCQCSVPKLLTQHVFHQSGVLHGAYFALFQQILQNLDAFYRDAVALRCFVLNVAISRFFGGCRVFAFGRRDVAIRSGVGCCFLCGFLRSLLCLARVLGGAFFLRVNFYKPCKDSSRYSTTTAAAMKIAISCFAPNSCLLKMPAVMPGTATANIKMM